MKSKNKFYIIFMVVFLITTILFGSLYIVEKTGKETVTTNYLTNYYTQAPLTDKLIYRTLIIKVFGDDGKVESIIHENNDTYINYGNPMLYCNVNKFKVMSNSNILKLYYEYDVKVVETGQTLSNHIFMDIEYEILENNQVKFLTAKYNPLGSYNNIKNVILENEIYKDHNMSTFYVSKNLDLGFSLRFDYTTIVA